MDVLVMGYLANRILSMIVILLIISIALFGLLTLMPGSPIDLLVTSNPHIKPEDVARLKRLRGLDRPWYIQYMRWMWGYNEPARPPVITLIKSQPKDHSFDLSDYLIDPNYVASSQDLHELLTKVWPLWPDHIDSINLKKLIAKADVTQVLAKLSLIDINLQHLLVTEINKKSSTKLKVRGLFGSVVQGKIISKNSLYYPENLMWFVVTNDYGQETVGKISLLNDQEENDKSWLKHIPTLVASDLKKPFMIDLKQFIHSHAKEDLSFTLVLDSPGYLSNDGIYRHQFSNEGQSTIYVKVSSKDKSTHFAFNVEHGVIGHRHKFNHGFIYVFLGDSDALGYSQSYKRPVYELLFGDKQENLYHKKTNYDHDGNINNASTNNGNIVCYISASISNLITGSGRIGNTMQLMLPALLLSLLIAIPLGVISAYRQYSLLDHVISLLSFIGISLPVFWFGIMMIYLFAEKWPFFPAGGVATPGIDNLGLKAIALDRLQYAILPTVVLAIFYVGRWLRYIRSSMLEVLPKDYIRTARAKGLSESKVIYKHALKNALIPVVTILALSIPTLFGGAVLTETVFSWPGIGRLQYEAVMNNDYYVAIVVFLISAILVMLTNFAADIIYVLIDPRMRKTR